MGAHSGCKAPVLLSVQYEDSVLNSAPESLPKAAETFFKRKYAKKLLAKGSTSPTYAPPPPSPPRPQIEGLDGCQALGLDIGHAKVGLNR